MLRKKLSQRNSLCGHAGHCSYPRQIFIHPKCTIHSRYDGIRPSLSSNLPSASNSISIFAVCLYAAGGGSECHIKARA